jgi:hypothetical protein
MAQPMLNLGGNLSPEQQRDQQQIARQQRMAELLVQQGQQTPQGQMVSGRYVAPNFFQYAAPLLQGYLGKKELEKVEDRQLNLAKAIREQGVQETQRLMNLIGGRPATPEQVTEMAGPFGEGVGQGNTNIPMPVATMAAQPAIEANPRLALAEALNMQSPQARALLPTILERAMPAPKKPIVVAPGGALVDESGKLIYQAPFKPEVGAGGEDGGYNKKGDWITPNGIFIGKSEVSKDREIAFTADQVRQGLKEIKPEDVKKAASVFGSVTGSGPISYIAQQFGSEAVSAQAKINASSVMQILNNLPPGAASDKDIENAKSTFPGYGNQKALNDWIKNTKDTLDRKVNSLNQKYGSENWYGNVGLNALNTQDKEALDWANSNPKDPRSAEIKKRLGK